MCGVYKVLVSTKLEIDYSATISLVFECGSFELEKNVCLLYRLIKAQGATKVFMKIQKMNEVLT